MDPDVAFRRAPEREKRTRQNPQAEALKDQYAGGLSRRVAAERSAAVEAADALDSAREKNETQFLRAPAERSGRTPRRLDAATELEQIEAALPLAEAAGLPANAPEVVAALARRDRALATLEREAILEEVAMVDCSNAEECDVVEFEALLEEARSLGVDAAAAAAQARALETAGAERASKVAAAILFRDEAARFYDGPVAPKKNVVDENIVPDL